MYFYSYRKANQNEIEDFVADYFQDKKAGRTGDYFLSGYWQKCLYLKDLSDVVAFKLSLGEYVNNIVQIEITPEKDSAQS